MSGMWFTTEEESAKSRDIEANYNAPIDTDPRDSLQSLADDEPMKVIIKTKDTPGTRGIGASTVMMMSAKINAQIDSAGIIAATMTRKDVEKLKQKDYIERIEPDTTVYAFEDTAEYVRKLAEETPYGIEMVLQDMTFWNNLSPPSGTIKVCVADTGYDLGHVDNPKDPHVTGSDSDSNGSWDSDGHGHGTHCSGTVAGLGGNNEGVVGVIPEDFGGKFQLVIGKALSNSGSGSLSGVLEAVQGCVDDGAKVISLSLGGGGYSKTTDEFYTKLYNEGILFVAAAGNGGSSSKLFPASYPALMSTAAIDSNKNKASFSQYNDQVEIAAPGVSVKSSLPNDKYASWSGTSMATPHVAGVAGLLWMYFPDCKNYQIRNVIAATAMDLGSTDGCDTQYGYGLVQAKAAYELLAEGNCGGDIGTDEATGGCEQLYPEPNCEDDSDCDDGDACSTDTCNNGQCKSTPNCASCGKSNVEVIITIDNYGEETAYDIKDSSGTEVMKGSGWPSHSVNSFWKCFDSGSYTFTIKDGYGDGLCCTYGNGGYEVKVEAITVASGGDFDSEETKTFQVGTSAPVAPTTPAPITPTPGPSTSAPIGNSLTVVPSTIAPISTPSSLTIVPSTIAPVAPPSSLTVVPSTIAPVTPGPSVTSPISPTSPYPTQTPPTMYPTHVAPTMYPTGTAPTPYPTGAFPTIKPTEACGVKGVPCTKHADCCSKKCNLKKSKCRKQN